jgi:hypothetical protein
MSIDCAVLLLQLSQRATLNSAVLDFSDILSGFFCRRRNTICAWIVPKSWAGCSKADGRSMQNGNVIRAERQRGADVWEFRWREQGADGKRKHRRIVLGSVEPLADEAAARQAISALRLEFNRGGTWLKTRSTTVSDLVSHYRERELDPDTVWKTHSTVHSELSSRSVGEKSRLHSSCTFPMPHRSKLTLDAIRSVTSEKCPHCRAILSPGEYLRLDSERLRCVKCGRDFIPSKKSGRPMRTN